MLKSWTRLGKPRHHSRRLTAEPLEPRCLLAGDLVAHWRADDLVTVGEDGTSIQRWNDLVSGIPAEATGTPQWVSQAVGSRSAIRLFANDGDDFLTVSADASPLSDAADFSVVVAFATSSVDLVGEEGEWFNNTALVDASNRGFTQDWGMSINSAGRIAGGMGRNIARPPDTLYSAQSNLNDGQVHLSTMTRNGGTLSLYIDDTAPVVQHDLDTAPRAKLPVLFGSSTTMLPLSGDIIEIRFFDGALTPEEVAATHREISAPVAVDDDYFATDEALLTVAADDGVLANDVILNVQDLTAHLVAPASNGTVQLMPDGSFSYEANPGFVGVDSFSYQAMLGESVSNTATVSIVINSAADQKKIVINELHTDPVDETEFVEFIELHNTASVAIQLRGWYLNDAVDFVFPDNATVPAGGYVVVAQDTAAFQEKFGSQALGQWEGRLRNSGEVVELRTNLGTLIDRVDYRLGFPWPTVGESGKTMQLINTALANDVGGAWRSADPTPGQVNSVIVDNAPPQIRQVQHDPEQPKSDEPVTITAKVSDSDGVGHVELQYQLVAPGSYIRLSDAEYATNWTSVPMNDDGTMGDAVGSDGIYTAVLPNELQVHRQLVRYRVSAQDTADASITVPYEDDPQPNFAYFVYDGVPEWTAADRPGRTEPVTFSADVMTQLATYHLIADSTDVRNSQYVSRYENRRFHGTMVYDGHVYDHIEFRIRGEFSTYQSGKNKWKIFFNRGHSFQARDNYGQEYDEEWSVLNFSSASTPWVLMNRGMAGLGESVAYRLYELAGNPSPHTNFLQFRVIDEAEEAPEDQYNGDLWGLYLTIEHPNGRFLDERGLPDGTTYKVESANGDIKNQGPTQPDSRRDFSRFMRDANQRKTQQWWEDNVDLNAYFTFRAVNRAINNMDIRDGWNHYLYHNPETDKWTVIPWDLDMLYVPSTHWSGVIRLQNSLQHDELETAYQNRARELQDLLFIEDQIGQLVDEHAGFVNPQTGEPTMVDVDRFMWNYNRRSVNGHRGAFDRQVTDYNFARGPNGDRELISGDHEGFAQWVKDFLLPRPGGGSSPAGYGNNLLARDARNSSIPDTPTIQYAGEAEFPLDALAFTSSVFEHGRGGEFAAMQWRIGEITDPNAPSFDPSQPPRYEIQSVWESGELPDFQPQIAIPPHAIEVGHAYRARVRMKDSDGRWSHWSEPVQFIATAGSADQLTNALRISEIHFNPSEPSAAELAAGHVDNDDFEFIELVNVGDDPIDLRAAQFIRTDVNGDSQGITFDFSSGNVHFLDPGQHVVVVEDTEAFAARYGDGVAVAGQWQGRLSNGGEQLTLLALGSPIQQFSYSDQWHEEADGNGPSLELINANSDDLNQWGTAAGWRPSRVEGGTPGTTGRLPGDSNHDGRFNSSDLVSVFTAGEFEDEVEDNSDFEEGDWDGDGDFTTADLVLVFQLGLYERAAVAAVRPLDDHDADESWRKRGELAAAIDAAFSESKLEQFGKSRL